MQILFEEVFNFFSKKKYNFKVILVVGVPSTTWQLCDSPSMSLLSQDGIVIPMDKVLATAKPERVLENKTHRGISNLNT